MQQVHNGQFLRRLNFCWGKYSIWHVAVERARVKRHILHLNPRSDSRPIQVGRSGAVTASKLEEKTCEQRYRRAEIPVNFHRMFNSNSPSLSGRYTCPEQEGFHADPDTGHDDACARCATRPQRKRLFREWRALMDDGFDSIDHPHTDGRWWWSIRN